MSILSLLLQFYKQDIILLLSKDRSDIERTLPLHTTLLPGDLYSYGVHMQCNDRAGRIKKIVSPDMTVAKYNKIASIELFPLSLFNPIIPICHNY